MALVLLIGGARSGKSQLAPRLLETIEGIPDDSCLIVDCLTLWTANMLEAGDAAKTEADDVAQAGPTFPLVGAGIGAAVGGIAAALAHPLSPLLAVSVALAGALSAARIAP